MGFGSCRKVAFIADAKQCYYTALCFEPQADAMCDKLMRGTHEICAFFLKDEV